MELHSNAGFFDVRPPRLEDAGLEVTALLAHAIQFLAELARVTAPNGRILIVRWCHRDLQPGEQSITADEQELSDKVCDAYYLPAWCSPSDYVKMAEGLKLTVGDLCIKGTRPCGSCLTLHGFVPYSDPPCSEWCSENDIYEISIK